MFITESEREGSCYFEFQFCKADSPVKNNCVDTEIIEPWKSDSLLISDENFDSFYELYTNIFCCALLPNGEKGFEYYGINYYDNKAAEKILQELNKVIKIEYKNLVSWLQIAAEQYNGFYILGI